jgi:hypothetical protein
MLRPPETGNPFDPSFQGRTARRRTDGEATDCFTSEMAASVQSCNLAGREQIKPAADCTRPRVLIKGTAC